MKNYYSPGTWNIICDSCGKKMKASHAKHRWDGFIVCNECFEYRHPQDLIRTKADKQSVPFSRPKQEEVFTEIEYNISFECTHNTSSCNAGLGVADCATVNKIIQGYI